MERAATDYTRSLKEAWKKHSFFEGLNEHDVNEIMKVQELYCLHLSLGRDVPDQIRYITEESAFLIFFTQKTQKAAIAASPIQYQASTWENRMKGRGKLRVYAKDMIAEICGYQTRTDLDQDSAECMFLEEIKHWATYEMALYELRDENLEQIEVRVKYFEAILSQDKLFYSIKWKRKTAQQIISSCAKTLKYSVIPEIKNEIALQCAREKLSHFRFDLKEALQQGIYFLYHVFRDSGETQPEVATLSMLAQGTCPTMRTGSGKLLYHVLSTGAFAEAFPDDVTKTRRLLNARQLQSEYVEVENKMDSSTLYDREGNLVLPLDVWEDMVDVKRYNNDGSAVKERSAFGSSGLNASGQQQSTSITTTSGSRARDGKGKSADAALTITEEDRANGYVRLDKSRLEMLFSKKLGRKRTGMEEALNGHPTVAEQFVKAHAQIHELAKFVQIVVKAEKCAGGGGDLLLYGFANKQLNALLESYRNMVKMIRSQFELVLRMSELRFQDLVEKNAAEPERNTFVPHYREVHNKFYQFSDQLDRTDKHCETILREANSLTLLERFQQLQRDADDFIANSDVFSRHINRVMGIPYNPAIGQRIMVVGSGVQSAHRLLDMVKSYSLDDLAVDGGGDADDVSGGGGSPDRLSSVPEKSRRSKGTIFRKSDHRSKVPASVPERDGGRSGENNVSNLYKAFEYLENSSCGTLQLCGAPQELIDAVNLASTIPSGGGGGKQAETTSGDSSAASDVYGSGKESDTTSTSTTMTTIPKTSPRDFVVNDDKRRVEELQRQLEIARIENQHGSTRKTSHASSSSLPDASRLSSRRNLLVKRPRSSSFASSAMAGEGTLWETAITEEERTGTSYDDEGETFALVVPRVGESSLDDDVELLPLPSSQHGAAGGEIPASYRYDWKRCAKSAQRYRTKKRKMESRQQDVPSTTEHAEVGEIGDDNYGNRRSGRSILAKKEYQEWMEKEYEVGKVGNGRISFDHRRFTDYPDDDPTSFLYLSELDAYLGQKKIERCHLSMRECFPRDLRRWSAFTLARLLDALCWKETFSKIRSLDLSNNAISREDFRPLVTFLCHPRCRVKTLLMMGCGLADEDFGSPVTAKRVRDDKEHRYCRCDLRDVLQSAVLKRWILSENHELTDKTTVALQEAINERRVAVGTRGRLRFLHLERTGTIEICVGNRRYRIGDLTKTSVECARQNVHQNMDLFVDLGFPTLSNRDVKLFDKYEKECCDRMKKLRSAKLEKLEKEKRVFDGRSRTAEHFKYLIRACRIYERCSGFECVPLDFLVKVFSVPFYGIPKAFASDAVVAHVRRACNLNVLHGPYGERPTAVDVADNTMGSGGSGRKSLYVLSETLRSYDVSMPERVSMLLAIDGSGGMCVGTLLPLLSLAVLELSRTPSSPSLSLPSSVSSSSSVSSPRPAPPPRITNGCELELVVSSVAKNPPFSNYTRDVLLALIEYAKILGILYQIDVRAGKQLQGGGGIRKLLFVNTGTTCPVDVKSFPIPHHREKDQK